MRVTLHLNEDVRAISAKQLIASVAIQLAQAPWPCTRTTRHRTTKQLFPCTQIVLHHTEVRKLRVGRVKEGKGRYAA